MPPKVIDMMMQMCVLRQVEEVFWHGKNVAKKGEIILLDQVLRIK
jgi:hypothetical protein